jgi:hypothetical protein
MQSPQQGLHASAVLLLGQAPDSAGEAPGRRRGTLHEFHQQTDPACQDMIGSRIVSNGYLVEGRVGGWILELP